MPDDSKITSIVEIEVLPIISAKNYACSACDVDCELPGRTCSLTIFKPGLHPDQCPVGVKTPEWVFVGEI